MKGLKDTKGKFVRNISDRECVHCKRVFRPRLNSQKFCNRSCMGKECRKDHYRKCKICEKLFWAQSMKTRFCSHDCYTKSGTRTKKGSENHLWKGGITPLQWKIRTSTEYKKWRKTVFERDNYTCVWCTETGGDLNVDHIIPFSSIVEKVKFECGNDNLFDKCMKEKLMWDINNGRTLCLSCHRKTDTYGFKGKHLTK